MNYYYVDSLEEVQGPVQIHDLRQMLDTGRLQINSYVIAEGESEWGSLEALLGRQKCSPPPTPTGAYIQETEMILLGEKVVLFIISQFLSSFNARCQHYAGSMDSVITSRRYHAAPVLTNDFYAGFFGAAEQLETASADYVSRVIIKKTSRPEIRHKTYISLSNEIRSDAFLRFSEARKALQEVMSQLGIKYETVASSNSAAQAAVQGALVGGAIQFVAGGGKSGAMGALAGGILASSLAAANTREEKYKITTQIYSQGSTACMLMLESIPRLSTHLFDQFIVSCLVERPAENPSYEKALCRIQKIIESELIIISKEIMNCIDQIGFNFAAINKPNDSVLLNPTPVSRLTNEIRDYNSSMNKLSTLLSHSLVQAGLIDPMAPKSIRMLPPPIPANAR